MKAIFPTYCISMLLLISCGKKNDILKIPKKIAEIQQTNKPQTSPINLRASFIIGKDSFVFQNQNIESRLLSINYLSVEKASDEVLLGYKLQFSGTNKDLEIFLGRKFTISSLKNNISKLSPSLIYEEGGSWRSYTPTRDEFLKIFEPRKLNIVNQNQFQKNQGEFALSYNELELVSYNPGKQHTNDISIIEIDSIAPIKRSVIKSLLKPSNNWLGNNTNREYYLISAGFKLKLFNEEGTKSHMLEKGTLKAVIYRNK